MANFPTDDDETEEPVSRLQPAALDADEADDGLDAVTSGITSTISGVISRARGQSDDFDAMTSRSRAKRGAKAAAKPAASTPSAKPPAPAKPMAAKPAAAAKAAPAKAA